MFLWFFGFRVGRLLLPSSPLLHHSGSKTPQMLPSGQQGTTSHSCTARPQLGSSSPVGPRSESPHWKSQSGYMLRRPMDTLHTPISRVGRRTTVIPSISMSED
ncbi:hypothetical protein B0H65DRAFT_439832 [Neurospora tetraspora]|uniref:Uncharacterized protein n=1 Tax=Neurospora tetraspora TaxID=94610 RepID=A0AAE0JJR1_9PEZI|nr:hypothetical protein B0H65DRAFT_439832 [Neurospora tetraspora]